MKLEFAVSDWRVYGRAHSAPNGPDLVLNPVVVRGKLSLIEEPGQRVLFPKQAASARTTAY